MRVYIIKQGEGRSIRWWQAIGAFIAIIGIFSFIFVSPSFFIRTHAAPATTTSNSWPTYAFRPERTGYNSLETLITPSTASSLKQLWSVSIGNIISVQPIIANGLIYWGSWDGIFHANRPDGSMAWTANLGQTPIPPACTGRTHGVMGAATFAQVTINGISTPVVFVGGGKDIFYALNANTGAIIWQRQLSSPPTDIWASSLSFNSSIYISTSAWGDCPLVQAQIFRIDAATGTTQNVFNVVPNGCNGASVWGSVSVDTSNSTLYFATGNPGSCAQPETNGVAVVELNATNLAFIGSWQVPSPGPDSDFGDTPTVFTATIGGTTHRLVGVANKNGIYYALDEANISHGPVWQQQIAVGGQAPEFGQGSISPSAWDGTNLYVAGGNTTINGQSCKGAVRAVNPATGASVWQACLNDGPVLGPVSVVPGVVAVSEGNALALLSSSTGNGLFKTSDTSSSANQFYGGPAVVNGSVYIGNEDGKFYAFGVSGTPAPGPSPTSSSTPVTSRAPVNKTWYFAEGKVGAGFTEFLTIENPGPVSCAVTIQYLLGSGAPVTVPVTVPAGSRYTESVNSDLHTPASSTSYQAVSTLETVSNPTTCKGVVAERPMYFTNFQGISSGTDVLGATHTGSDYYFADVSSLPSYHSYLTILNPPGGATATLTATYYLGGTVAGTDTLAVPAGTRGTILPKSFGQRVATWVHSSAPVVVERPTYFSNYSSGTAHTISGAASVVGAPAPATDWRFAEGYTGGGFQESLLLANFGTSAASGKVVLEYDNGSTLTNTVSVPAHAAVSLDVNTTTANKLGSCAPTPCALSQSVSAEITVSTGALVAEREMFFQYSHFDRVTGRTVTAQGGTDVTGQSGAAQVTAYSFAEGYSNQGYDEWLTVQNPTASSESIAVILVNGDGHASTQQYTVGAHTRFTIDVGGLVSQHLIQPGDTFRGYEVSMTVQSTSGAFVAERPMYWDTGFSGTQGGSDVIGYLGN